MLTLLGSCVLVLLFNSGLFLSNSLLGVSMHRFYYIDGYHDPQSLSIATHGLHMGYSCQ